METDHLSQLRKVLATDKIILGTDRTFKEMRKGGVSTVYVCSNAPKTVRADLAHYSKVGGVDVVELSIPNDELGTVCRKQFSVSMLSVRK